MNKPKSNIIIWDAWAKRLIVVFALVASLGGAGIAIVWPWQAVSKSEVAAQYETKHESERRAQRLNERLERIENKVDLIIEKMISNKE